MSVEDDPNAPQGQAPSEASHPPSPTPSAQNHRALSRLRADLSLLERVLRVERERVAALADRWGHHAFASHLRERMKRERIKLD
jgi:hypothetical protein